MERLYMKNNLLQAIIFIFGLLVFSSGNSQSSNITPTTIFEKINLPKDWSKVAVNHSSVYKYKIKNDSGKNSIAISNTKAFLYGTIDYSKFGNANELLTKYSKSEIKQYFLSGESRDERVSVSVESINDVEFGGLAALAIHCIYSVKQNNLKIYLIYYIIRGKDGWITIGLSSFDSTGYDDFNEMNAIIKKIDLTKKD